jgi:collagenase-like PrtC family protease
MIKFSVPTNWRDELFSVLNKDHVDELYGKFDRDIIGGGRPSFMLPVVSKTGFVRHIKEIHKRGISFNYLLNATCIGSRELTTWGQRKLRSLLDYLVKNNVDAVTVSIPYLLEFIKHNYSNLKVYVSTMAGIDSLQRAQYWESLGADRLTLSAVSSIMRNFALLRKIRKSVKCELQLIANLTCLRDCPFWQYHAAIYSHASQSHHRCQGFLIDYCFLRCNYIKIKNPVEFIRAGWIRPEDLKYYEAEGVDRIKFANRNMGTESIAKLVTSYAEGRYEGNLLDLFSDKSKYNYIKRHNRDCINKLRYFFRPFSVNIFKLLELRSLLNDTGIYIDNRALDGFLEQFIQEDCSLKSCQNCNYCQQFADKAVKIDIASQSELVDKYYHYLDNLNSGDMFTYFRKK